MSNSSKHLMKDTEILTLLEVWLRKLISAMQMLIGIILIILGGVASEFTDEANARLPHLFHLDDYERCLSQEDGIYCLGIFELSPIHPSSMYERIKEYSNLSTFNRSRLHRGYCLSERCPSTERNATVRFERCVSERARRHALTARLHTLHHCTSHLQHTATPPHPHTLHTFLQIVAALLLLNVIGTVYDVATGEDQKKIGILTVWSVRSNWRRLTDAHEGGDPRLKELELINGLRVICMCIALYAHAGIFYYQYFVTNPQFLENILIRPLGVMLSNGTSLIQVFVMVSNFLVGYNLLIYLEKNKMSMTMLPVLVAKRFARMAPVHALVIGFTATWWPRIYSGPFHSLIEDQSAICRRKFWSHVFFYSNLVDRHDQCLIPAWFLPVDMHLYILACTLIIVMQHRRQQARRLFGMGFIVSSIACGVISYCKGWTAMIHFAIPENERGIFVNVDSFGEFYTSTWGSMMACFLGLYMAYLFYDLRQSNYNFNENKWIKFLHPWCIPFLVVWVIALGTLARQYDHPLLTALYIIIDRPAFIAIAFFFILGMFKLEGINRCVFSWSGWRVPGRLSLPVMLCHWLVINYIAARPTVYHASLFAVTVDYVAMIVLASIIAVPISLLVEIPVQRFVSQLI